jgi:hypothetical protein
MMRGSASDPLMVREDFEILTARNGNKRDAAIFRESHPGRRWGGHGDNNRRAEPRRLLDKLDRDPARQQHDAMRGHFPSPHQCANELIERIVAPDVLPDGD